MSRRVPPQRGRKVLKDDGSMGSVQVETVGRGRPWSVAVLIEGDKAWLPRSGSS